MSDFDTFLARRTAIPELTGFARSLLYGCVVQAHLKDVGAEAHGRCSLLLSRRHTQTTRAHARTHSTSRSGSSCGFRICTRRHIYIYIYIYIYADAQAVLYRSTSLRFFLCLSLSLSLSFCLSRSLNASTWPYVCSLTLAFIDLLMNPRAFGAFRAQGVCNQSSWLSWPHGCM